MPLISVDFDDSKLNLDEAARDLEDIGTGSVWTPAVPGRYVATIEKLETRSYRAKFGDVMSEDKDGKWNYLALQPVFRLHDEALTQISRQDFTMGVVDENSKLFRPDGDSTKSPLWQGNGGAKFLLVALGLVDEKSGRFTAAFDSDIIVNRPVNVGVDIAAYRKGSNDRLTSRELHKRLRQLHGSSDYLPTPALDDEGRQAYEAQVAAWPDTLSTLMKELNEEDGFEGEEVWKVKNVVYGVYAIPSDVALAQGYVFIGRQLFASQADADNYTAAVNAAKNGMGPTTKKAATPKKKGL